MKNNDQPALRRTDASGQEHDPDERVWVRFLRNKGANLSRCYLATRALAWWWNEKATRNPAHGDACAILEPGDVLIAEAEGVVFDRGWLKNYGGEQHRQALYQLGKKEVT